ncbi:hypothetical protein ABZ354_07645 [Streptomyces sp. NPDC005925]|uniref:hypothetical protein n=1 Tax=Streptomyces sp. NPDC005925 TaxID=3157172 RepID=UPI00340462ED
MPSTSVSTGHPIPAPVLEILGLPSLDDLADDQTRGATCVWCQVRLTAETAVDLGEHLSPLPGTAPPMHWFPRACRKDTADRAHRGLFTHAPMCEQCTDDPGGCEISRWLYRLVRENRR